VDGFDGCGFEARGSNWLTHLHSLSFTHQPYSWCVVLCFNHGPFRSLSSFPFIGEQEIKLIAIPVLAD
jgi:hypothetical protein